jgi:hypothetical protein
MDWIVRLDALKVAVVVKGVRSGTDLVTIGKTSTDDMVEVEVAGFTSIVHCEDSQVPIGSHDYGSSQSSQCFTEMTSLGFAVQFKIPQTGRANAVFCCSKLSATERLYLLWTALRKIIPIATNTTGRRKEVGK